MKVLHRIIIAVIVSIIAVSITSCSKSKFDQATGKGTIKAIHAATGLTAVAFRIEERTLGSLTYKDSFSGARYDNLPYQFNFDLVAPVTGASTRIASQTIAVDVDMDYTLVLTGTAANASVIVWERPENIWKGDETNLSVTFGNVAASWGDIDVYFAPTGTLPVLGEQVATLSYGERAPLFDLPAANYEIILTAAGDPATIYFQSSSLTMNGATNVLFAFFDNDGSTTADLSVRLISGGNNLELGEVNHPPQLRVIHSSLETATATGNVDAFLDADFATAIASDVAFGTTSPYWTTTVANHDLSITPAGNTGVITAQTTVGLASSTTYSAFLFGTAAEPVIVTFQDKLRFISDYAKLRFVNGSENHALLDIYVEAPATDITNEIPYAVTLPSRTATLERFLDPGTYEVTITTSGEKTAIVPPFAVTVAARDVREILVTDTVDPATADAVVITDLNN